MGDHLDLAAAARPSIVGDAGFFVPASLAAGVAKLLEQGEVWARQNAIPMPAGVSEVLAVARITGQRNAERRLSGTRGIPADGAPETMPLMTTAEVATMSTAEVSALLGCSARNVTELARRGTLPGRRLPRTGWRFHPDDVAARVAAGKDG